MIVTTATSRGRNWCGAESAGRLEGFLMVSEHSGSRFEQAD